MRGQAFLSGAGVLRRPLRGQVTRIGRGAGNHISPQGAGLSKQHAELRRTESGWLLIDLGSRNGTYVGGARVQEALLPDRAELRFGGAVMWFELSQEEQLVDREALPGLVGGDAAMIELARLVRRVAPTTVPVLIKERPASARSVSPRQCINSVADEVPSSPSTAVGSWSRRRGTLRRCPRRLHGRRP